MELSAQAEVDAALRSSTIHELREQQASMARELSSLNEQIGDLAFNNYRTYADAGRTTQQCTKIFTEMNSKLKDVTDRVPALTGEIRAFFEKARNINDEAELVKSALDRTHPLWDLLGLPAKMDMYIRTGYYDSAYALTNYGMTLQQSELVKNPLVKLISDRMVESRALLLEELFNKFAGPLDLAASIQVVNNVRKMPLLSPTQLRVAVLQHRDLYLEKQLIDIAAHPSFVLKAIDVYQECMYETVVLYTAVFPDNEITKKDPSIDPRWELWPESTPSVLLGEWAGENVRRLLELVERAEMKAALDISSVWTALMNFGASFGRMGLDYRPIILQRLKRLVLDRFRVAVRDATTRLESVRTLHVLVAGFANLSRDSSSGFGSHHFTDPALALAESTTDGQPPTPSAELSAWDDVCVYGNGLLEAINGLKYTASPAILSSVLLTLRESLDAALSWLSLNFGGAGGSPASPHFARATRLLAIDLVIFLNSSLLYYFPYESVSRLYGSCISKQQYLAYLDLSIRERLASCDGADKLEEVLLPLLNRPKISPSEIDAILARKPVSTVAETTETQDIRNAASLPEEVTVVRNEDLPGDTVVEDNEKTVLPTPVAKTEDTVEVEESTVAGTNEAAKVDPPRFTLEEEEPIRETERLERDTVVYDPLKATVAEDPIQAKTTVISEEEPLPQEEPKSREVTVEPEGRNPVREMEPAQNEEAEGEWGWGEETREKDEETAVDEDGVDEDGEGGKEWGWGEGEGEVVEGRQKPAREEELPPKKKGGKSD